MIKKYLWIAVVIFLPLFLFNYFNFPHARALALTISILILWFLELIPLALTGLSVPILAALYQVMPLSQGTQVFLNPILFLFLGSFLLSRAMQKHDWDKRMIYFLLSHNIFSQNLNRIILSLFFMSWILSFWISNTAACAILTPIALSLGTILKEQLKNKDDKNNLTYKVLLGTAFSASIGGIVTPIGSPPNLIAIHFLSEKNLSISFLQWTLYALPLSLLMLGGLIYLLHRQYPISNIEIQGLSKDFNSKLRDLGPLKITELQVAIVFITTVLFWLLPGLFNYLFEQNSFFNKMTAFITMEKVAMISAILLFLIPHKNKESNKWNMCLELTDLRKISWSTLIIFAGGLALGKVLNLSGLSSMIGQIMYELTPSGSIFLFIAIAILITIIVSELGSNTASASIVIPIVLANLNSLSQFSSQIQINIIFLIAIAASFGFILPVSTPPNAIIFATGKIPLIQMKRTGLLFDILGYLIILLAIFFFLYLK